MPKYYEIDEAAARRAKEANSFYSYVEGSATASYRREVDRAVEIAERQKSRVSPEYHDRIDGLLDAYARRLAANYNHRYSIDARVPSVMVAGPAKFPVKAKEKQNAARDSNMAEYQEIQGLLDKITSCGMGGVMSDDPAALDKLRAKLKKLEDLQAKMKAVNAYYRKHKTLEGCPDLTTGEIQAISAEMKNSWRSNPVPFEAYELTNNNATIKRTRDRVAALEAEAARAAAGGTEDYEGKGYTLRENTDICRIQFIFDGKPDDDVRSLLKSHGFKWSPREGAWQRLLNDNARSAAACIAQAIDNAASDA